jgi:site-specific DNA recombinase
MRMAAIYARVSSEQQREAHTIASQTTALIEWAKTLDMEVPKAWIFEDDGYSGATLERPGLERVRDLAAEGQIQTVLVYSPDRLSRKYAYQILLIEELARQGVETRFLNAPQSATAEDQLLVQFQGMIAEYERAQILERSRRGKRHRARAGEISVLSGAPYGYRYIRKSDEAPASYTVIETEARVVRDVYERYTVAGASIGAITRGLNAQGVATRKPGARWERSMIWAMLRNPAYRGTACFGKTRVAPRQRVTRALRMRGGMTTRNSANHERPREEWIEIPVPALIAEETFARAQELLHENKVRARRRTIEPSVVQGLVSCRKCGYALSRTSTRSRARPIHYYRCIGSDGWRHLGGPVCKNRPVRQDLLDQIVWTEVMRLLEDPALIEQELDRRLAAARAADPTKQREQTMQRELVRVGKSIERLLTAYQEELLSLEQLRERMPPLRQRDQTLRTELHALVEQTRDRATYLRLAETLSAFLERLRLAAETLDVLERQRIVRLVVKEVLVGDDTIVIRHSIPVPSGPPGGSSPPPLGGADDLGGDRSYLLRTGRGHPALRRPPRGLLPATHPAIPDLVGLGDRRLQPLLDQPQHRAITDTTGHARHQRGVRNRVEVLRQIGVHNLGVSLVNGAGDLANRVERAPLRSIPVGRLVEVRFEDRFQHQFDGRLHHPVPYRRNPEWPFAAAWFGHHHPAHRRRPIRLLAQFLSQCRQPRLHSGRLDVLEARPVHTSRSPRRARDPVRVGQDVVAAHLVVQEVEPERRLLLRLHVQRPLQPPNTVRSRQAHANLLVLGHIRSTQK